MRWLLFFITTYAAAALSVGLGGLVSVGASNLRPDLLLVLLAFLALQAPQHTALIAALILGLTRDTLASPVPDAPGLVGPFAVGFVVGHFAILQLRHLLVRDSIITLALMVLAAGLFAHLTAAALLTLRGLPFLAAQPVPGWSALGQIGSRLVEILYTGLFALPLGWLLIRFKPLWRFPAVPRH